MMSDDNDFTWDLSNTLGGATTNKSTSSAPSTEISRAQASCYVNVMDDTQESVVISSESNAEEESYQESRRRPTSRTKTPKKSRRPRSVDHALSEPRGGSQGRNGPPRTDPIPKTRNGASSSSSRDRGGGMQGLMSSTAFDQ